MACIQGGSFPDERKRHAAGIALRSDISGVAIGGLGTGESPAVRDELIDAALSELPERMPRFLPAGVGQTLLSSFLHWPPMTDAELTPAGNASLLIKGPLQ